MKLKQYLLTTYIIFSIIFLQIGASEYISFQFSSFVLLFLFLIRKKFSIKEVFTPILIIGSSTIIILTFASQPFSEYLIQLRSLAVFSLILAFYSYLKNIKSEPTKNLLYLSSSNTVIFLTYLFFLYSFFFVLTGSQILIPAEFFNFESNTLITRDEFNYNRNRFFGFYSEPSKLALVLLTLFLINFYRNKYNLAVMNVFSLVVTGSLFGIIGLILTASFIILSRGIFKFSSIFLFLATSIFFFYLIPDEIFNRIVEILNGGSDTSYVDRIIIPLSYFIENFSVFGNPRSGLIDYSYTISLLRFGGGGIHNSFGIFINIFGLLGIFLLAIYFYVLPKYLRIFTFLLFFQSGALFYYDSIILFFILITIISTMDQKNALNEQKNILNE